MIDYILGFPDEATAIAEIGSLTAVVGSNGGTTHQFYYPTETFTDQSGNVVEVDPGHWDESFIAPNIQVYSGGPNSSPLPGWFVWISTNTVDNSLANNPATLMELDRDTNSAIEGQSFLLTHYVSPVIAGTDYPFGIDAIPTPEPAQPAYAYVPNEYDNTVSVIDTSNDSVVATIPVAGNYADGVAVSPNGKFAYVASESGVVSVIDTASQRVSATIPVGSGADFVAFSPDSTRAYVTHFGGNSVAVIDTSSNSVIANITVGSGSYAVAVSPDGSKAYVTNENSGTVSVIDTSSNTVIDTVNVGDAPTGIAVSPDGSLVYASNFDSGTVSVINTATNSVVSTINVGGEPEGVVFSPDGSHTYVANFDGTVSVIDTATNSVVDTINVGGEGVGIAITPNGADLYVSHYKSSDTVSVIDTKTDNVVDTVNVGSVPEFLAIESCCFWRGTLINTPDGYMKVENLKVGQLVDTVNGPPKRVVWLGKQTLSKRFSDPLRALPIRVRKDALADNVPSRDLMLSPDHAIFFDEILVQAGALVNGVSIVRETRVPEKFVYYHVELDEHALLVAENTPVESFVDNSDRLAFDNWAEHETLYPDGKPIDELPYPRAKSYRQVPYRLRDRLASRAARDDWGLFHRTSRAS
jgi:YVTN family beta-propeller protein